MLYISRNKNIYLVEYVPELRKKLTTCAAYITYGGYNATVEILKGKIPSILDYQVHIAKDSMFNTPAVFPVYTSMLTLEWLKNIGGISAIEEINNKLKSKYIKHWYNLGIELIDSINRIYDTRTALTQYAYKGRYSALWHIVP